MQVQQHRLQPCHLKMIRQSCWHSLLRSGFTLQTHGCNVTQLLAVEVHGCGAAESKTMATAPNVGGDGPLYMSPLVDTSLVSLRSTKGPKARRTSRVGLAMVKLVMMKLIPMVGQAAAPDEGPDGGVHGEANSASRLAICV